MKIREVEILVNFIQVSCPKCGTTWGIQVKDKDINNIPIPKLLCNKCTKNIEVKENLENGTGNLYQLPRRDIEVSSRI